MAPSRKNLSAATAILLLLVIVAAGEMASAGPVDDCRHLSGNFPGYCVLDTECTRVCLEESSDNIRGECDKHFPDPRCWCITNCLP